MPALPAHSRDAQTLTDSIVQECCKRNRHDHYIMYTCDALVTLPDVYRVLYST